MKREKEVAQAETLRIQKEAIETLEYNVKERTKELNESNEKLKELDKLKTSFFMNVSHELRTPLTLIISPVESIIRGDYGESVKRNDSIFHAMYSNSKRLLRLITNLLDFSKIESGKMSVKREEADITKLVSFCISNVDSAAHSRGLRISFEGGEGIQASVDRDLFEKAVYNLLSNAIKFNRDGGIIDIRLEKNGETFVLAVRDTGIGIPGDKVESIFVRFSQVDSSSARKYEGTGIGLSLTKEIVELHGGTISVKSIFNVGSEFMMTIPLFVPGAPLSHDGVDSDQELDDNLDDYRDLENRAEVQTKNSITKREHAILIVEDNRDMSSYIDTLLNRDYNTFIASNGREALEKLGEMAPDLILADVMMPEMDGFELMGKIRSESKYDSIPIILLTAKSDIDDKVFGIEKGASDYITKPFSPRELTARVRAHLKFKILRDRLLEGMTAVKESGAAVTDEARDKMGIVMKFLEENYTEDISREGLASAVDMSPDYLSRVFNQYAGKRIGDYINELRIKEASRKLLNTNEEIIKIAMDTGFESLRTFNRVFAQIMGKKPSEYRKEGEMN